MLAEFGGFLEKIIVSTWNMLNSSSPWIIFSFLVAGLLHEFLKPEKIQKTAIGSGRSAVYSGQPYQECLFQSAVVEQFHLESVCITAGLILDQRWHS